MVRTIKRETVLAIGISWRWAAWLWLAGTLCAGLAEEGPSPAGRAEETFRTQRVRFQKDRSNVEAAWQFARACFDWAELATQDASREEIALQGIESARRALALDPTSAEAHYYLALNLGQLARTKSVGALKLVREMEREFKLAIALNEKMDHAGPRLWLGILYRDAPGWPASIGSRSKARAELERAAELFPNFPSNRLYLAESHVLWGERRALQSEIEAMQTALAIARQELTGELWKTSWEDWDERWRELQRAVRKNRPPGDRP